jgi:hypothetical protein
MESKMEGMEVNFKEMSEKGVISQKFMFWVLKDYIDN